jgi:hypothetical protein
MDYSLLCGLDVDRQQVVVGIIDYLHRFDWRKGIESGVKRFINTMQGQCRGVQRSAEDGHSTTYIPFNHHLTLPPPTPHPQALMRGPQCFLLLSIGSASCTRWICTSTRWSTGGGRKGPPLMQVGRAWCMGGAMDGKRGRAKATGRGAEAISTATTTRLRRGLGPRMKWAIELWLVRRWIPVLGSSARRWRRQ